MIDYWLFEVPVSYIGLALGEGRKTHSTTLRAGSAKSKQPSIIRRVCRFLDLLFTIDGLLIPDYDIRGQV